MTVGGDLYQFGPFRLDPEAGILYRGAEPTMLGQRAVALLRLLLQNAGVPVSKDALVDAGWGGLAVADNNLTVQIAALRRVLADAADAESWIETLPRRGYRYVGPAVATNGPDASAAVRAASAPILPEKPPVAVLPFSNLSGDPQQEYFAEGMVDDIITGLARIHWLFVIARNSTFTYKGRAVDVKQVGRELGVRYVLEGSVRKAGERVRITGQLIDTATGAHLWADRFDGSLEDVFDLQDKEALSVAGIIEPALQAAESRRSANRQTNDLTAYDLYLRAIALFYPVTKERLFTALGLLEQAIAIDPSYGLALSWAAVCHLRLISDGWAEQPETNRRKCIELSRRALQVGEDDPGFLANTAIALVQLGEDIGAMMGLIDRALVLNPSFARGWFRSGLIRIYAGQLDLAIEHFETSLRLSPRERVGAPLQWIGMAYFFKRQFDEAASKLLSSIQENPGSPTPYRALAACYAHMGRLDESYSTIAKMRGLTSLVMPTTLPYRIPDHRE